MAVSAVTALLATALGERGSERAHAWVCGRGGGGCLAHAVLLLALPACPRAPCFTPQPRSTPPPTLPPLLLGLPAEEQAFMAQPRRQPLMPAGMSWGGSLLYGGERAQRDTQTALPNRMVGGERGNVGALPAPSNLRPTDQPTHPHARTHAPAYARSPTPGAPPPPRRRRV